VALTPHNILTHPAFPQLYLSRGLAAAVKPTLPAAIEADEDITAGYGALFAHLAQDTEFLCGWGGQTVLCRNMHKKGYQEEDVEQWLEVYRYGRCSGRERVEKRKAVRFSEVLERVRFIEARGEKLKVGVETEEAAAACAGPAVE
jgi:hypothetical protein